jgi:ribonuclease P protein component
LSLFKKLSSFKKSEIQALFKTARTKIYNHGFTIKIAPKQSEIGRILVITPRKVGNAPQRNLIRRRLKAIFFEEKMYEKPYDCIVFVTPAAVAVPFSVIKELLISALGS